MVAAGILCLSMAGQHQTPMALAAGDWLLAHRVRGFGDLASPGDRFFYGTYYSTQAMVQLGGHYWAQFFPSLVDALLSGQSADGSWPPEIRPAERGPDTEAIFGKVYTSALAVLSLTPPYQLLPIYQRQGGNLAACISGNERIGCARLAVIGAKMKAGRLTSLTHEFSR